MILDDIKLRRTEQLEREKARISFADMKKAAERISAPCKDFKAALSVAADEIAVIAEVKKASPSKGIIRPNFKPAETARQYERAGAKAISCLTEEYYFKGSGEYLKEIRKCVSLPILRKDFIFDPYQIYEARVLGADAILLIAAMLDTETIREYKKAADDLGLNVLAESHNEEELNIVLNVDCKIIGINNRNLKTFEVTLDTTERLGALVPKDRIIVAESGVASNGDVRRLKSCGASALLIGETLMKSSDIAKTLHELTNLT